MPGPGKRIVPNTSDSEGEDDNRRANSDADGSERGQDSVRESIVMVKERNWWFHGCLSST